MGKVDQISMKRGKTKYTILGKFGRKVKKLRKKTKSNNCTGVFFPQKQYMYIYTVSNKYAQGGFFPKKEKRFGHLKISSAVLSASRR